MDDLLARIREAPDDDAPRLVLADALLEQGDPWGEIIVLSCRLDREESRELRERVTALRQARWPTKAFAASIRRGFFDRVWANDAGVAECVGLVFAMARELRVRNLTDAGLTALAAGSFEAEKLRLDTAHAIAINPALAVRAIANVRCRMLVLSRLGLGRAEVAAILAGAPELRGFELSQSEISEAIDGIAWPALESLVLSYDVRTDAVIGLLANEPLHGLSSLALSFNPIDDTGAHAIAATPFRRLTTLELLGTNITSAGLDLLAGAPALRGLTALAIGARDPLDSLHRLATFTELRTLRLDVTTSATELARFYAAVRAPLHSLELRVSGVDGPEVVPPLDLPAFRELRSLDIAHQGIGDAGAIAIARADLPHLERLELSTCRIGPAGALAFVESTTLPARLHLSLYANDVGPHAAALYARYREVVLKT